MDKKNVVFTYKNINKWRIHGNTKINKQTEGQT